MTIFKRIRTLTTATIHNALDQLERPEVLLKQGVRDIEHQLSKVQYILTQHVAHDRQLQQEQQQIEQWIDTLDAQIRAEARSEGEDRARFLLPQLFTLEKRREELLQKRIEVEQMVAVWKKQLHEMTTQLRELYQKRDALIHRAQLAHIQKQQAKQETHISGEAHRSLFYRMEQKVIALEAEAEIAQNAHQMLHGFTENDLRQRVEQRLQQYKK